MLISLNIQSQGPPTDANKNIFWTAVVNGKNKSVKVMN